MRLVAVSEGPTHRVGGVGNVLVCVYRAAPPLSALQDRIGWVEAKLEEHDKVGLLVVVDGSAGGALPDAAFRAESRRQAHCYRGRVLFSASVLEGTGIHHTLLRTFLRGLGVVAGSEVTVRFFSEVPAGAEWAAQQMSRDHGPTAPELIAAVDELREI